MRKNDTRNEAVRLSRDWDIAWKALGHARQHSVSLAASLRPFPYILYHLA